MISLLDIAERIQTGEKVEEKQWDMELFKTISSLVKKHGIEFPGGDCFINLDESLPERAFEAGIECLETLGIYCITTKRRVRVSREEILTAIREVPTEILMGEGRDRRVWKQKENRRERETQCLPWSSHSLHRRNRPAGGQELCSNHPGRFY